MPLVLAFALTLLLAVLVSELAQRSVLSTAILFLLVAALGTLVFDNFQLFVILTLFASLYVGRIMHGHLIDGIDYGAFAGSD